LQGANDIDFSTPRQRTDAKLARSAAFVYKASFFANPDTTQDG
jgi:hypothetical protein